MLIIPFCVPEVIRYAAFKAADDRELVLEEDRKARLGEPMPKRRVDTSGVYLQT